MKKLVFGLLAFLLVASVANAVAIPGLGFKNWGAQSAQYGKYSFDDNGNTLRLVYKTAGNTVTAGMPAFTVQTTNSYTVTSEPASSDVSDNLAGIFYCNTSGSTTITKTAQYCWVLVSGYYATTYFSFEGTASPAGAILKGVSGKNHLTVLRALGAGAATGEGGKKIQLQVAMTSDTGVPVATAKVIVRGMQ